MPNALKPESAAAAERVSAARDAVAAILPGCVVTQTSSPAAYSRIQKSYWNVLQQRKAPSCFFQPTDADQVKAAVVEVVRARSPFSIKGGGHSSNPDGSSLDAGLQFDLALLDHVEVAEDRKTVRVGPGVRWGPLLQILEKRCLTVVGGRDFGVGVPGFVFGGGLSYHSATHGWGIDNLVSADIVLASGELITVDEVSHPELNRALHGGGAANFGIVTSLTLKTFPYSGMWGGMFVVGEDQFDAVFDAYDEYSKGLLEGAKAHMIMDFLRREGKMVCALFMGYPGLEPSPHVFRRLCSIPSIMNTLRVSDYSDLATEMAEVTNSRHQRNAYWTLSMEYDIDLIRSVYDLFTRKTTPYSAQYRFGLDFNHITPAMRNQAARRGAGNVYGLEGPDEHLINVLITAVWDKESDDVPVSTLLRQVGTAVEDLTRQRGKSRGFKYMNYANQEQDVVAGFGEENKAFLKRVAAEYDPTGVFQTLRQGPWKLDPPVSAKTKL